MFQIVAKDFCLPVFKNLACWNVSVSLLHSIKLRTQNLSIWRTLSFVGSIASDMVTGAFSECRKRQSPIKANPKTMSLPRKHVTFHREHNYRHAELAKPEVNATGNRRPIVKRSSLNHFFTTQGFNPLKKVVTMGSWRKPVPKSLI
jgi:hypothetical protein